MDNELVKTKSELEYYINVADDVDIHIYKHGEELTDDVKDTLHLVGLYKYNNLIDIYGYYLGDKILLMEISNGYVYSAWMTEYVKDYLIRCTGIYEATDKMRKIAAKCCAKYVHEMIVNNKGFNEGLAVAIDKPVRVLLAYEEDK